MKKWDKVYFVGAKAEEAPGLEGRMLADWWKDHPAGDRNRDGKIEYVYLGGTGPEGETAVRSFEKALADSGIGARRLGWAEGRGRTAGASDMNRLLSTYGRRLEAVVCDDDETALGAIDALRAKGYMGGKRTYPSSASELPRPLWPRSPRAASPAPHGTTRQVRPKQSSI